MGIRVATHEPALARRRVALGSERNFGLVFAAVFALIGFLPLTHGGAVRWWSVAITAAFLVFAFLVPRALRPLNLLWFRFGLLLHAIVNPLIMLLLYYGAFVPTGLVVRAFGKDLLRLKWDNAAQTYWIMREPAAPMTKQF